MQKENISFEDLMKVDVRLGNVTEVEKVEGTDKLYKLEVDFGEDIGVRTVVSAIAHQMEQSQVLDNTFPFVLNLAPRKIRGIESQAMILLATNSNEDFIDFRYALESDKGSIVL